MVSLSKYFIILLFRHLIELKVGGGRGGGSVALPLNHAVQELTARSPLMVNYREINQVYNNFVFYCTVFLLNNFKLLVLTRKKYDLISNCMLHAFHISKCCRLYV